MAGNTATLVVKILGDSKQATAALAQVDRATGATADATAKAGKKMGVSWAAVGAAMLGCVKASSMTESAIYALNTVFGEQGDEMADWAAGMAEYGLSTAQAGAAAAVMGAQLKTAGFSAEEMTTITQGLVETSAQLAQVMGVSTVEACAAMSAALKGEYDSLDNLGINLTAATVQTEMLRLEQMGLTFATEEQAKIVATLSLIQQQSTEILKDAEEGVVTMQMATDHLKASTKNLASMIGDVLTPILTPLIDGLAGTIDKLVSTISESEALKAISEALADVLAMVADILDPIVTEALQLCTTVLDTLYQLLAPFVVPIVEALGRALDIVADALATVIGWVEKAIDAFQRFTDVVYEAIDSLTFWSDNYQSSAPPTAMSAAAATATSRSRGRRAAPTVSTAGVGSIVVAPMFGDSHAIAREIRRILREDAARLGAA